MANNIVDKNGESKNIENIKEDVSINKKKALGDKIFGAHNNPDFEMEYSDSYEVDVRNVFIEPYYDEQSYLHKKELEEIVYKVFQNSRWFTLSYKKKIPKELIPHLFHEILEKIESEEFSFSEKFVCVCDYIHISYIKAYEIAPIKYKEIIINELEEKYKIISKKNVKRLF